MAEITAPPPSAETYSAIGPMTVLPGADDLELVFKRTFDAPRELVYEAFTDSELLAQWWGPTGYTVPSAETDPRPGGEYHLVLQAPDGTEYPVFGMFVQAERPDRVVMTDEAYEQPQDWEDLHSQYRAEDNTPLRLVIRVMLEEADRGTEVTIVSRFPRVAEPDDVLRTQATRTWQQSLNKLEQMLSHAGTSARRG